MLGSFAPFSGLALSAFFVFHFVNSFTISTTKGAAKRQPTATDKAKVLRDCSMVLMYWFNPGVFDSIPPAEVLSLSKGVEILGVISDCDFIHVIPSENHLFCVLPHPGSQSCLDAQIVESSASCNKRRGRDAEKPPALNVCDCVHFMLPGG